MTVLPQLERELRGAHERRRTRRWRVLSPRGEFATALAAAVAVAVAVVGLVTVGHGPTGSHAASRTGNARPVTAQPAQARPVNAQIVANFAPFRRPRTPADAAPTGFMSDGFGCFGPTSGAYGPAILGLNSYYQLQCFTHQQRPLSGVIFTGQRIIRGLQFDQSRAVRLPGRLGTIWLIPSGRWLCNLLRSPALLPYRGHIALICEPVSGVLAHPPLPVAGGIVNNYLLAIEPDRVTKVIVGYRGGTEPTYLAHNLLGACVGIGTAWLEQTGPTIRGAIKTLLGDTAPGRGYKPPKCPQLPS